MKSITIHNLDDRVNKKLTELSRETGLSMNKTIKKLLNDALGFGPDQQKDFRNDFSEFLGVWSTEEYHSFETATRVFDNTDPWDWK